jgi:hypothetical protein
MDEYVVLSFGEVRCSKNRKSEGKWRPHGESNPGYCREKAVS